MKKPTTNSRTAAKATKSRAPRTTKHRATPKNKVATKVVRRKAAAPKGLKHHAKRLYHVTPKFIHGMIAGAIVGFLVVGILSASTAFDPTSTSAASGCDAHGIGSNTLTHSTNNSAYTITGNKTTVTFDVVGKNCKLPITMVVWKAPNGTTGKPYSAQTLFNHVSATFAEGRHHMTTTLPDCYFQVDTVTGTKLTGSTGQAYNYDTRQVAFMHGGTQSCTPKPVAPTPSNPTPPTTPVSIQVCDLTLNEVVPIDQADLNTATQTTDLTRCQVTPTQPVIQEAASVQTLPKTGAGAVILIAVLSVVGGAIFHRAHHHVRSKKKINHAH